MITLKKSSIFASLFMVFFSASCQDDFFVVEPELDYSYAEVKPDWRKQALFLLGCLNGFYMPLTHIIAKTLHLFDGNNPVIKEHLEPFTKGATIGIGCWFAYMVVEWYLRIAVLKALKVSLHDPVIKIIHERDLVHTNDTATLI